MEKHMENQMENQIEGKVRKFRSGTGFWTRLKHFFGLSADREFARSRFEHFVQSLDKKDAEYPAAKKAAALCDESIAITIQRVSLIEQMKGAEKTLLELNCYEDITDEDSQELKEMMQRLKGLTKDKMELKGQIAVFDPNLATYAKLENDAKAIQGEIKDAEQTARVFRRDIHALRGEKTDLEYDMERLMRGEKYMRRFMFAVAGVFVLCVLIFGFSAVTRQTPVAVPLTVMTILATAITGLLVVFRRRFAYELKINHKKQQKAVGMLNKKSAVFAHYTNFLNFTYNKYKVRNADMLNKRLKEYDHYKHLTRRYDALRKLGDEIESDLYKTLTRLKIPVSLLPLDNFSRNFNLDEMRNNFKNAADRKASIDKTLAQLDEKQEALWERLTGLNRIDGGVVDSMIKFYMEEAGKIILNPAYVSVEAGSS